MSLRLIVTGTIDPAITGPDKVGMGGWKTPEQAKAYYLANKDRLREYSKDWQRDNKALRAEQRRARSAEWAAQGLCNRCGHRPPVAARVTCDTCLHVDRSRWTKKAPVQKAAQVALRAERRAAGLCLQCGRRSVNGSTRCEAHRVAQNSRSNAFNKRYPGKARERLIKHKYGLTLAEWNQMLSAQGGRCAICRTDKPGAKNWATDHDHEIEEQGRGVAVRGILCDQCNQGLGQFRDNPEFMEAGAAYIRKHRASLVKETA